MLLALALQAAAPQTAVDAERAFNAAAQAKGQWTAFREFAAPDAIVFTPQPEKAETALPTKNPPIAVQWWPAKSYVSCDGTTAINTGPWVRPGSVGYFTTVWRTQPDGAWKWQVDHGDALEKPRAIPERVVARHADCRGKTKPFLAALIASGVGEKVESGYSPDKSLAWSWLVRADGSRKFVAWLWVGGKYRSVVDDEVAAPK